MTRSLWRYTLLLLLLAGLGFRLHGILVAKRGLSHDESVSYLCASATQGAYAREVPTMTGRAIAAGDIQAFYRKPERLDPALVAKDLVRYDIHPPLYFWTLHAVQWAFGFHPAAGALLNMLAGLVLLFLLYRMARDTLGGPLPALAVCVVWYLAPAVAQVDLEARHYQFLGLFALASVWLGHGLASGKGSVGRLALFTAVNTCGFLTHYYYGFLLVPGAFLMLLRYRLGGPTVRYIGSLVLSLLLFFLLFPGFFDFLGELSRYRSQNLAAETSLPDRAKTFAYASLAFFSWWHWGKYAALAFAVAAVVWTFLRHRSAVVPRSGPMRWYTAHLVWHMAFTALLYLLGTSPAQAVGEQYFAYFWPLLALLAVHWAIQALPLPAARRFLFPAYALQLTVSCFLSIQGSGYLRNVLPETWYERMERAGTVVTNETRRGHLPRIALHLDPGTSVFLLSPQDMEAPLPDLEGEPCFLFSDKAGGSPDAVVAGLGGAGTGHRVESVKHYQLHLFQR